MNNYVNNGIDTISAGKFVERGSKPLDISKIRRIGQSIYSSNLNAQINEIGKITSDNIVTPEEKVRLLEEWNYIKASFASITSSVTSMGELESVEYKEFEKAFNELKAVIEPVLVDMDKPSEITSSITTALEKYSSSANTLNIYTSLINNNVLKEISDLTVRVVVEQPDIRPGDNAVFKAEVLVYKDGWPVPIPPEVKELYRDPDGLYRKLYQWKITGTKRDPYWTDDSQGKEIVTIPYSEIAKESITAYFNAEMIVG